MWRINVVSFQMVALRMWVGPPVVTLAGNTGLIVVFIVRALCLWPAALLAITSSLIRCCRNASYALCVSWSPIAEMSESSCCAALFGCSAVAFFFVRTLLFSHMTVPLFSSSPTDKNFEDDDSVDGGRSSSSSKGTSLSGRKAVSMGSFRRPASGSKSAGQNHRISTQIYSWGCKKKNKMTVFAFCGSVILSAVFSAGRDGSSAGAVDEEDFIQAFEDVPKVQVSTYVTCTSNCWPSPSTGSKTPARVWTFSSLSPPSDLL